MLKPWRAIVFLLLPLANRTTLGFCNISSFEQASTIMCTDTTIEDYLFDVLQLDLQTSTGELQLAIRNSSFRVIATLLNPARLHRDVTPPRDFTKLTLNFCEVRLVEEAAFGDFDRLTDLDLGFNEITDMSFVAFLRGVRIRVNLTHNRIQNVDFAAFGCSMDILDLSFNRIIRISLSGKVPYWSFPVYRELLLNDNRIREVELHPVRFDSRFQLDISNNNISFFKHDSMEFGGLHLDVLEASQSISSLSILPRWSATTLRVPNNPLEVLESFDFSRFSFINLSNCSLHYISPELFQEGVFTHLNLSHNSFRHINASSFARSVINTLDVSFNAIENISSAFAYSTVTSLNLTSNNIKELNSRSFEELEGLRSLFLSFNGNLKLNSGSFKSCTALIELHLAWCNMSEISGRALAGLTRLRLLNLSHNALRSVETGLFKDLGEIQEVDLRGNQLVAVQSRLFSSLKEVRIVNLSGNHLQIIQQQAFHNLSQIKRIEISNNVGELTIHDGAFYELPEVEEIGLVNCSLKGFSLKAFTKVEGLQLLNLKDSSLGDVNFRTHYFNLRQLHLTVSGNLTENMFFKLVFLKELTIWNSHIGNVQRRAFNGLYRLETLQLPRTDIGDLSRVALEGLFALRKLDASNLFNRTGKLRRCTFKNFHRMKTLVLSGIQLEQVEAFAFEGLKSLRFLNLSLNKLSSFQNFTFSGLSLLETLDLSGNSLAVLERGNFLGLTGLKSLDLSRNGIDDVDWGALQAFPHLVNLTIARNNLTEFKVGAFSNLLFLRNLNLEHNSISSLPFESFLPLKSLEVLNLEHNNLKTIEHISLASNLKSLKRIGIADNKWKCEYLAKILVTFRNRPIRYGASQPNFYEDNIDGIRCIDVCKYLLCLKDSHGIN